MSMSEDGIAASETTNDLLTDAKYESSDIETESRPTDAQRLAKGSAACVRDFSAWYCKS